MQRNIAFVFVIIGMLNMGSFVIAQSLLSIAIQSSGTISYAAGPLHTEGRYIKDNFNNTIYLRGVCWDGYEFGYYGDWPAPGDPTPHLRRDGPWSDANVRAHYQNLRDNWGINAMRWHFVISRYLENTANGDAYRYAIRRGIELAQEYGIYIILDPFRLSGDDWNKGALPFYPYDQHLIDGSHFYEQDFINFWVSIANDLKDSPNWIVDPYNEPHYQTWSSEPTDRALWESVVARLITALRPITNNIIIAQWLWGVWLTGEMPSLWVDDFISYLESQGTTRNVALSIHLYRDSFVYVRGTPNTKEQLLAEFTQCGFTHMCTEVNYPVIIGEIGCDDTLTGDTWTQEKIRYTNALSILNDWGVSYLGWVYASPRESGRGFTLLADGDWIPPPSEEAQIIIDAIKKAEV